MIRFKMILLIACLSLQAFFVYAQEENAAAAAPAAVEEQPAPADAQPAVAPVAAPVPAVDPLVQEQLMQEEAAIREARDKALADALKNAQPLFGGFKVYIKRTSANITLYLSEEDRTKNVNPLAVFTKDSPGYKSLVDNSEFGSSTFVNSANGEDIDYKTTTTDLVTLGRFLIDEQKMDDASQLVDRFLNEYINTVKEVSLNYQTEFESVKIFDAVYGIKNRLARNIEDNARQAYVEKKYDKAIVLTNISQKIINSATEQLKKFRSECKTEPHELRKLDNLIGEGSRKIESLQKFEDDCKKQIASEKFLRDTDFAAFDPERPSRHADIEVSLAQAKVLLKNDDFVRARDALEKVLVRDPYNQTATRMLQTVYDKLYQVAKMRRFNEEQEIISENRWNWNEAVLPTPAIKPAAGAGAAALVKTELSDKLSEILIDQIDFEEATITSVVNLLIQRSRELDPSANKTGVSILLRLKPEEIINTPKITMSLDGIPLGEVIRYICQACGLKYRVEERAVIISSEITDVMETRFFKVRGALINNIAPGVVNEGGADTGFEVGGGGGGIDLAATLRADDTATPRIPLSSQALKDYFNQRGVNFVDPNTAIAYDRRGGKLVVKNTPENLRRLESLLRDLDIETPLVLIESKFIELTQDDTEELGFEWALNKITNGQPEGDWTSWSTGGVIPGVQGGNGVAVPASTASSTLMGPHVAGSTIVNNLMRPVENNDVPAIHFPGFGKNNKLFLDVVVHAMDRSGKAEILSAPKVIATSGQPALIRMVRTQYFPTSWTEPEITIGDGVIQIVPSYPELGDATDLGIRLEVTATVSPNNYTISLNLHPQVRELINWTDYSYTITTTFAFGNVTALLKMPILSLRDVTTNVKVYDGETLILGGMIRDDVGGIDDRIPGLGDIPLIGRLWRTKTGTSSKKNLVIFVTARLVNPDGIPVRIGETRGLPDFRR
ncbi:MAG TPA: hypothetical protein DCZ94_00275 [Lentisphaeria bacterium]|nr:MAG: hypothetical protein A2X48_18770 [Lentisphaerae bacterium GWF2_49_21]HBC85368.1 hypothetical protein [Lentisphaeria bacterium]